MRENAAKRDSGQFNGLRNPRHIENAVIQFQNTYAALPESFHSAAKPSVAKDPKLLFFNEALSESLGLDLAQQPESELAALFSGAELPSSSKPIAQCYAGHQFGSFSGRLGDGRAILLGEIESEGTLFDLQLKGAGRTEYSRGGDGRAWLGPVLREYIVSEAMFALGVPTTRSLAAVTTGEEILREARFPGAVVARIASSHLRVGTFEYFTWKGMGNELRRLASYAIERHYPELAAIAEPAERYLGLFRAVADRQLKLVAEWMRVGFIHGVMNTDNTTISGETIDFGPCAFMDTFRFDQVYSSIDRRGRYRYRTQGQLVIWNLAVFASTLLPLLAEEVGEALAKEQLEAALDGLDVAFVDAWCAAMGRKLGLENAAKEDAPLIEAYLEHLETNALDFTNASRALRNELGRDDSGFYREWAKRRRGTDAEILAQMDSANPVVIPRNHQIERCIQSALNGDRSVAQELIAALANPYNENESHAWLQVPPEEHEVVHQTFCGT